MWTCDTELVSLPVQRIGGGYCRCVLGVRRLGHSPEKVRVNGFRKGVGSRFGNDSRTLSGDSPRPFRLRPLSGFDPFAASPFPASTTSVSPRVLTAMAGCLRDLPATGWHNNLAASFVRNLKSRGQCDLRSQSSPPRGLAASSDGGEVEVVWPLRCNAKHRRLWKKKRPTLKIRTVCGYPSGMSRPRFSPRFATRSARWGGLPR